MSALATLAGLLQASVPAWIVLLTIAAAYFLNLAQQAALHRRLDVHARTIGHMDRWAGLVDERLDELAHAPQRESLAFQSSIQNIRNHAPAAREMSNEQVRKLVSRIAPARAA